MKNSTALMCYLLLDTIRLMIAKSEPRLITLNGYLVELSIDIAFQSTPRPRWQRFQDYRTRLT